MLWHCRVALHTAASGCGPTLFEYASKTIFHASLVFGHTDVRSRSTLIHSCCKIWDTIINTTWFCQFLQLAQKTLLFLFPHCLQHITLRWPSREAAIQTRFPLLECEESVIWKCLCTGFQWLKTRLTAFIVWLSLPERLILPTCLF